MNETGAGKSRWLPLRRQEAIALGLLGLFVVFKFWAILSAFSEVHYAVRQPLIDLYGQHWLIWWFSQAFWTPGVEIFHVPVLNYPVGTDVVGHVMSLGHEYLGGLLRPWLGGLATANLLALLAATLAVGGLYCLLRHLTRKPLVAAAATIITVSYSTFHDNQLMDLGLINSGFLTLGLATWLAFGQRGGKVRLIAGSLLFGLCCLGCLYYGIAFGGVLVAGAAATVVGLTPVPAESVSFRRRSLFLLVGGLVAFVLVMFHPLSVLVATGLFSYNIVGGASRVLLERDVWMGIVVLGPLIAVAGVRGYRTTLFWLALALVFHTLSLGDEYPNSVTRTPTSAETGAPLTLPLGYLMEILPFFYRFHSPDRFALMTLVALACAALSAEATAARLTETVGWIGKLRSTAFLLAFFLAAPLFSAHTELRSGESVCGKLTSGGRPSKLDLPDTRKVTSQGAGSSTQQSRSSLELLGEAYLWPAQRLETFRLPTAPDYLRRAPSEGRSGAVLHMFAVPSAGSLNMSHRAHDSFVDGMRMGAKGRSLCFQVEHGLPMGYDLAPEGGEPAGHRPSPLSRLQRTVTAEYLREPDSHQMVVDMGVRYLLDYLPCASAAASSDAQAKPQPVSGLADLPWLEQVDENEFVRVFEVRSR